MNKHVGAIVRDSSLQFAPVIGPDEDSPVRTEQETRFLRRPFREVMKRQAALVVAVMVAGTGLVGVVAVALPPSYTATAQLIVEPTPAEIAASLLGPVIDTHITMLTSDRRLRRVLAETDAAVAASTADRRAGPDPLHAAPALDERLRGAVAAAVTVVKGALRPSQPPADAAGGAPPDLIGFRDSLLVRQERLSSIVTVSVRNSDPAAAAAAANSLVRLHVDELSARRVTDADRTRADQDRRIEGTRAELGRAEDDLKVFQAANGPIADDSTELVVEVKRQLAAAQAALRERETGLDQLAKASSPPPPEAAVPRDRLWQRAEAEHGVRDAKLRVSLLEARLAELQSRITLAFRQQVEQQALETRIASLRKLLDDLMLRRQEDPKDTARPFAAEARVFALAAVPSRPSSINPFLTLPPAFAAFGMLGIALALLRERADRTLRSEREVYEIVSIACLGSVPRRPWRRRPRGVNGGRPGDAAFGPIAQGLSQACDAHHGLQTVLVTSSRRKADKGDLAASLAASLAYAGWRVLLLDGLDGAATPNPGPVPSRSDLARAPDLQVVHDAGLRVDRATAGGACDDAFLDRFSAFRDSVTDSYDYLLLDAPPVLASPHTRLLATRVDGAVLSIAWAATPDGVVREAREALRRAARLAGRSDVRCMAVVTGVKRKVYARSRTAGA